MDEMDEASCDNKIRDTSIDYPLIYVDILGCHSAGVVMAFIINAIKISTNGCFKITDDKLMDCLGISVAKFRKAKRKILSSGIIYSENTGKRGKPHVTHYMFDKKKHVELVNSVKL